MEELKVGEKVTLEAIEQDVCNGCDASLAMMIHAITRPIMVGVMDFCVNLKNVLTENM